MRLRSGSATRSGRLKLVLRINKLGQPNGLPYICMIIVASEVLLLQPFLKLEVPERKTRD